MSPRSRKSSLHRVSTSVPPADGTFLPDKGRKPTTERQPSAKPGCDVKGVVGAYVHTAAHHHQGEEHGDRSEPPVEARRHDGRYGSDQDDMAGWEAGPTGRYVVPAQDGPYLAGAGPLAN